MNVMTVDGCHASIDHGADIDMSRGKFSSFDQDPREAGNHRVSAIQEYQHTRVGRIVERVAALRAPADPALDLSFR